MSIDFLSAFIIGLFGSGHCLGMCGGITTMLTSAIDQKQQNNRKFWLVILYHFGRLFSYSFIGFIVALSSSFAIHSIGFPLYILRFVAAIFLILLGLYLGQWFMGLSYVEKAGRGIWQKLSPLSKKIIPVNNKRKALALGMLWGWLPCGLVYSTLTWALASGDAITGALIMCFFGLGTLPALIALSFGLHSFKSLLINPLFKKLSAISLILFGIYQLIIL